MHIPTPVFVYSQWGLVVIFALALITFAYRRGVTGTYSLIFWRRVKLYSSLLGVIGIVLLLVRIDTDTRALITGKAHDLLILEFIDAKAYLAENMANLCAIPTAQGEVIHTRSNTCWDLKNINGQLNVLNIRDMRRFQSIQNWQNNPSIIDVVTDVNRRIESMNRLMPPDEERFILFGGFTGLTLLFWSSVLLVVAVSGSVGEAAYQYQDVLARAATGSRKTSDTPSVPTMPLAPISPANDPGDGSMLVENKNPVVQEEKL